MTNSNPELTLLYRLCTPVLPPAQETLWEILLNPENGDIIERVPPARDNPDGPVLHEILGRIQTPAEAAAQERTPAELLARAETLFRHRFDAGPHPRPAWFREILAAAGWSPEAAHPGQPRLTREICQAYGIPFHLPRNPDNPGCPPAIALSRRLADYDHVWAIYGPAPADPALWQPTWPPPANPNLWQASYFRRCRPEFTTLTLLPGLTPLPPGNAAAANSQRRRLWKNLKIQGHNKAGARRRRRRNERSALGLHPAWGQIGPFKHPGSAHSNWFRKAERDAKRAAAKAARNAAAVGLPIILPPDWPEAQSPPAPIDPPKPPAL